MATKNDLPADVKREIELAAIKAYEEEKVREKARIDARRDEEARKAEIKSRERCSFIADLLGISYDKEYNERRISDLKRK